MVLLAVYLDMHNTLLACCHLVSQGDNIGIPLGVGIGEDGLTEQACGVRMDEVASIGTQHHEIGIWVGGLYGINALGQLTKQEVGVDEAHDATRA